ncbi:MAG: hypothetical protein ACKOW5_14565 [Actinomycetales bacterium]
MSAATALDQVPSQRQGSPLRLVAPLAPDRVGRGAFTLIAVGVLALGLLAILFVNTMVAQGGFAVVELRTEQARLAERQQVLQASIAGAAAPAALEGRALALGMVRMKSRAFLRVSDGKVLGKATVAKGRPADADRGKAGDAVRSEVPAPARQQDQG